MGARKRLDCVPAMLDKDTCRYCGDNPKRDCDKHLGGGCEYPEYERVLVTKSKLNRKTK